MNREAKKTLIAAFVLVATAFALYANTLASPFLFDDKPSILENPFMESLWPLSQAFGAPPGGGSSGRPLVSLSLAINYAIGAREVLGYHLFNVGTLALGALALFGLLRRCLSRSKLAEAEFGLAFAIALLWMVHPLHTDTLNQVIYRNGSMMGLFYFLSLFAGLRSSDGKSTRRWALISVLAAAAAMASKEVAVSLPLAMLALDRQFVAGSFAKALRARSGLYAGLAATWGLLAFCVLSGDRGDSVGFGHTDVIDGIDYLRTQMLALRTYAGLTVLAGPFVFDYHGLEVVRDWSSVLVESIAAGIALGLSIYGFLKSRALGLLGLLTFAILAPTSSFIPLAGELIAEHRMYLPLAPLMALLVLVVHGCLRAPLARAPWLAPGLVLLCAALFAWKTWERNGDYASRVTLWRDTVEKRPDNSRAWNHYAVALKSEERYPEAEEAFRRTLALDPKHGKASFNYGNLLFARGDTIGALERFRDAARYNGEDPNIRFNYGFLLVSTGQAREGMQEYREALRLQPDFERPLMLLAWLLATSPQDDLRDGQEALALARRLNEGSQFKSPRHLDALAAAMAETGSFTEALQAIDQALRLVDIGGNRKFASELRKRREFYANDLPFRAR